MRILLCGCNGRMGHAVAAALKDDAVIAAGIDAVWSERAFPVYANPTDCTEDIDVVIDFPTPPRSTECSPTRWKKVCPRSSAQLVFPPNRRQRCVSPPRVCRYFSAAT